MPSVTFRQCDGTPRTVEAAAGTSLMQVAIQNNVRGIEAECGGACACATCHVLIDPLCAALIPPPGADEDEMLEGVAAGRTADSRLACQVTIQPELDGMTVRIPDRQF
ncbi:2Fe-2S iron-sulfur cluster-binding protein [Acidomonas methanolica]|uniref:2Fe-2S iron-sulfur cluster-binding protein n=1 Tax=Acidomonas methanolica TaxID=437 RepID=UPI00211A62BF|nr:2Fe-2S iron-sulfur cluster-binding protein [Acidomonas methanolica]MCQ9154938.1 2Fe-2S iron-sulfur cluster binding domain-containing protein [Acidomonas methanolica]